MEVWELLRPHLDSVAGSPARLAKMGGLLDALLLQFPMPPPALFAANDIDKCACQGLPKHIQCFTTCRLLGKTKSPSLMHALMHSRSLMYEVSVLTCLIEWNRRVNERCLMSNSVYPSDFKSPACAIAGSWTMWMWMSQRSWRGSAPR